MDDVPISGYDEFTQELTTLISTYPPPFIYIHDPISLRTTNTVLTRTISDVRGAADSGIHHAHVDAGTCFTQRLFFDTVINSLADFDPEERWNDSWDSFIHGLGHIHAARQRQETGKDGVRFVISVGNAHRLKEKLPDSIIPLSRLNELSQIDITVILLSQTQWQDLKPPLGASPEPYFIDIKPLTKSDIITTLSSCFTSLSHQASSSSSKSKYIHCYRPSLSQLYTHYISMICEICFPFIHDIDELSYIAAARWPGFIQPLVSISPDDDDKEGGEKEVVVVPPNEDTRLRLIRSFTPTITHALEELYPRLTNAIDWATANQPPSNILTLPGGGGGLFQSPTKSTPQQGISNLTTLPRISKFILLASYIASTNPPKTDLRMFGRGLDEKKRRRRNMRTQSKTKGPSKIPQHLLGPTPFPLDRMLAILGALLEENDADSHSRLPNPHLTIPGEHTDMEISRIGVYSAVMQLVSQHLLLRTSPQDRIDGPPMFKCNISLDSALGLAKIVDVGLNDLLWESM